jgi:LmbE family N-acetylglucosaminyl deacetylase
MQYLQEDVKKLGTILGIWAHPDDESWSSAGLMKMAIMNGQKVGIITATKGDAGETADPVRWPKSKLAEIRTKELEDCLCNVGRVEQFWLDYKDGRMADANTKKAVADIAKIINVFNPDTVVTFEPNGITGHDDHRTISAWSTGAVKLSGKSIRVLHSIESEEKFALGGKELDREFNIFFNVDRPNLISEKNADVCIKLDAEVLECKLCCLRAHSSQTSQLFAKLKNTKALEIMAATECFVVESD